MYVTENRCLYYREAARNALSSPPQPLLAVAAYLIENTSYFCLLRAFYRHKKLIYSCSVLLIYFLFMYLGHVVGKTNEQLCSNQSFLWTDSTCDVKGWYMLTQQMICTEYILVSCYQSGVAYRKYAQFGPADSRFTILTHHLVQCY